MNKGEVIWLHWKKMNFNFRVAFCCLGKEETEEGLSIDGAFV